SPTNAMKAEQVKILSASGSISLPKFVIKLRRRAITPSTQSVTLAMTKMVSARVVLNRNSRNRASRKTSVKTKRDAVSWLGRFIEWTQHRQPASTTAENRQSAAYGSNVLCRSHNLQSRLRSNHPRL